MTDIEIRSVAFEHLTTAGNTVTGRAVVYNSLSKPVVDNKGNLVREFILPGAFTRTLKENPDIRALREHNPMFLLGRTKSGTLKLEERSDGIYVNLDLPNTSYATDLKESITRGDISGFSFAFQAVKQRHLYRSGERIRELQDVNLGEISLTGSPAYMDTNMSLRSEGIVWEGQNSQPIIDPQIYMERLRHYKNLLRGEASALVINK